MHKIIIFLALYLSTLFSNENNYINGISFDGNLSFSDSELHSILKLKNPSLFRRSKFTYKMYNRDIQNLIGYYKSKGFQDINITGEHNENMNHNITIQYNIKYIIQF